MGNSIGVIDICGATMAHHCRAESGPGRNEACVFMTHQDSADSMAAAAIEQLYARTAVRLAQEHIAHCDGESCDISLQVLCEMAEKAGAKFTEIEKKLFF